MSKKGSTLEEAGVEGASLTAYAQIARMCCGALAMCMIGCAGPPTHSNFRMYHTVVAAPAFLVISTIGPSVTVLL
jgi:hypothetical protein